MKRRRKTQVGSYDQVGYTPGQLTAMVVRELAKIIGKDKYGRNIYRVKLNPVGLKAKFDTSGKHHWPG